jgi:thiol-disulfide isomerase/thioredoxin
MSPEFWTSLTVVAVVLIGGILIFRYTQGFYPGSRVIVGEPPLEQNGLDTSQARFIFFYAPWCPWSKKATKPHHSFKQNYLNNPSTYGGKTIVFEEIDATQDKGKAALYKVKAFPTFKLETQDKLFEYRGVPDAKKFQEFLRDALGTQLIPNQAPSS